MDFLTNGSWWLEFIFTTLFGNLLMVVIGILLVDKIKQHRLEKKHGGWTLIIKNGEQTLDTYKLAPEKQREIADDHAERDVFLKGRVSPHQWIKCNINDLLHINMTIRQYTIDLSKDTSEA